MDGQCFLPLLEPEALHKHEKAPDMIAVEMGEQQGIERIVIEAGTLVRAAEGFTAIEDQGGFAETVQERGMIPVSTRPAVSSTKTG
jgi:hypothetical protein